MADYIVKSGGTATLDGGRYTTPQSGSFAALGAANYYPDIESAIAASTAPVTGDRILVSDLHAFSTGSAITITGIASNPFNIICVDDNNIDQSRTTGNRGSENSTGVSDVLVSNAFFSGIELLSGDNISFAGMNLLEDCELTVPGSGDVPVFMSGDGSSVKLINSVISANNAGAIPFSIISGADVDVMGGSIQTSAASITNMVNGGFVNGGGSLRMKGVDISAVSGTLIANVGSSAAADDSIEVHLDLCMLASGVARTNETFKSFNQRVLTTRCSDSSAAAEYQYGLTAFGGDVDDDSAIFRNESPVFTDSNQKISYKIVTNSDASLAFPLWFDMPLNKWSVLSSASTDTLRFYLTSNTVLTDKDIYIEISYPDGTNKQTPNFLTSAPATVGGTLDLMAAGTTLTTDGSSTWTGALSNVYQIDVDTSVDVGSDSYPIIKVYTTIPNTTIQLSMDFDTL